MSILVKTFLLLSLCATAVAVETTGKIKRPGSNSSDKWDLEFLIAAEQTKDMVDKKQDGLYSKFDASLLQKPNKNDQFRYYLATRYIDTKSEDFGNEFELFFTELMYRRKNILTQADHGIYLETELKNYWVIDEDIKERYGYNSTFIPQIILKKSFGRKHSLKTRVRRHYYQTINQDNYTLNFEDRVYLDYSYYIGGGFLFNGQLKYQHKIRKGNGLDYRFMELAEYNPRQRRMDFSKVPEAKKHQEIVTLHPGVMYFIDRQNMIEVYLETKLSNTYDKRDLATIMEDELVVGTAIYLTAF